ncbi:MAG: hypothetical protein HXX81_05700 [Campylobacterales bacterium]|nr:hypothetical protein [Campylobacterales bacterium]
MKKLLYLIIFTLTLFSKELIIHEGWNLYGFGEEIKDIKNSFTNSENKNPKSIWIFQNGKWQSFYFYDGKQEFSKIPKNSGVWIFNHEKYILDINLDTKTQENITIQKGWGLFGSNHGIKNISDLSSKVKSIYVYRSKCGWVNNSNLSTIYPNEGFWIYSNTNFDYKIDINSYDLAINEFQNGISGLDIAHDCNGKIGGIYLNKKTLNSKSPMTMYIIKQNEPVLAINYYSEYLGSEFILLYSGVEYKLKFSEGEFNIDTKKELKNE